jgi:hypothetical protein
MMDRILKRPMFRMGGRSDDGIMSMRPGFQEGGNLAQRFGFNLARGADFLKRKLPGTTGILNLFRGTGQPLAGTIGPTATTGAGVSTAAAITPALAVAALADESYPVYPKGHPNEGERMSIKDAQETLEKTGGAVNIATGKGTQAGGAGDIAGEAAMFDDSLPKESGGMFDIFGNMNYPTKRNFDSPEAIEVSKEIGLLPKDTDTDDDGDDDSKNKGSKFDRKADLKTIYEDLLPMMEETLSDPDDKKRQLYTQLAQFGANLLAQPGGDLTGAIGKAAAKPLEGVGKVLARDADIGREAKLLALKTALDRTTPGEIGRTIRDLKAAGFSDADIDKYLMDSRSGSATRASIQFQEVQALKEDLTNDFKIAKNADTAARTMYDSIQQGVDQTAYSELPKSKNERIDGEYYVSPNGEVGRYDKKTGTLIKPGEKGFTGKKKQS